MVTLPGSRRFLGRSAADLSEIATTMFPAMFAFAPLQVPGDAGVDDPSTFDDNVFVGVSRFSHGHTPLSDNVSAFILAV
jgi:hypothetical protein